MLALGAGALLYSGGSTAEAADEFVIAITEKGFNPSLCIVNRGNSDHSVRWINKGTQPHQVVSDNTNQTNDPLFQTAVLQPGQTSEGFNFTVRSKFAYHDALNPSLKGTIEAGDGAESCIEAPPTPTPTNTPSVSPTASPTRTPSPTATPDPRKAYIPFAAKDQDN